MAGNPVGESSIRVLVVDDYEPWRRFVCTTLLKQPGLQIMGEVSDGLEAVQQAKELQPDLILMDIGLPTVNGIEAARRIGAISPKSRILFVSDNRSWDIAEEALGTGALGYVVKATAFSELLPAVQAVIQNKRFVSASLTGPGLGSSRNETTERDRGGDEVVANSPSPIMETTGRHEVAFYSDDQSLMEKVTQFIGAALRAGNAAIVVASELHRHALLSSLQAQGLDIDAAVKQGRYQTLDATEAVSTFMVHGMPDRVRFMETFGDVIRAAAKAAQGEHPCVAVFGEGVQILWSQGNADAALQVEKLSSQLVKIYDVDILCAYSLDTFENSAGRYISEQICAEHSAVHNQGRIETGKRPAQFLRF